jgi:SAM-dependent methyltransferase
MISSGDYNDPDVVRFYDIENGWAEDFDFRGNSAKGRRAKLDLSCGTGMLAADCLVVGVDTAAAMLALAKQRCGGASVSWVLDDARTVRLKSTLRPGVADRPRLPSLPHRIASPEMFPEAAMLPHLIRYRPMFIGGANDEADQHGDA